MKTILPSTAISIFVFFLTACSHYIQTSSGADYLAKNHLPVTKQKTGQAETSIEDRIRQAAEIEPTLKFPARIGLVKLHRGSIANISPEEAKTWLALKESLGDSYGEIIPINPLVAALATGKVPTSIHHDTSNTVNRVRLAAATQHLDAVLMYELKENTEENSNILSITNLTIVGGFFVPSATVSNEVSAHALLIDVLSGYPYATVDVSENNSIRATAWGSDKERSHLRKNTRIKTVSALADEVYEMMRDLRLGLAEMRVGAIPQVAN